MYEAILVVSVLIFGAVSVAYLRHPAASIFHPATFFLAFHGLVFVIRPIFAWYFDFRHMYLTIGFQPTGWDKIQVLLATNLSLLVFMAVVLWLARQPLLFQQDNADIQERGGLLLWLVPIAIPIIIGGTYALWWIVQTRLAGGAISDFDTATGEAPLSNTNGYFLSLGAMLGGVTVAIAYLGRFRWWSLAPFAGYFILRFATGMRGGAVIVSVAIALLYLFERKLRWPTAKFVIPALIMAIAFNAVQQDRGMAIRAAFGLDTRNDYYAGVESADIKPLETMDLANLEFFEYLVDVVPEKTGSYDYFAQNLQLFVAPIPRAIWKEKPVGAPIKFFDLYRYGRPLAGMYSLAGMGWYYMGYFGVAIWTAFFAAIFGFFYNKMAQGRQSNIAVMAYVIFLSTSILAFRDGLLYTLVSFNLFYIFPVAALALVIRFAGFPGAEFIRLKLTADKAKGATSGWTPRTPRERRSAIVAQAAPEPPNRAEMPEAPTPRQRRLARASGA